MLRHFEARDKDDPMGLNWFLDAVKDYHTGFQDPGSMMKVLLCLFCLIGMFLCFERVAFMDVIKPFSFLNATKLTIAGAILFELFLSESASE